MVSVDDEIRRTYRYVRLSLVGAVLALFVAVLLTSISDGGLRPSISAYYYSPARDVLVGVLVGSALALVAIRGRPGWENVLLDLAGALLPLVAFVPVPIADAACPDAGVRCVPEAFLDGVGVGVGTWLAAGVVVLALAAWTMARRPASDPAERVGFRLAVALLLGVGAWFATAGIDGTGADSFLAFGHYAAAVGVFACLVVVAWLNARRTHEQATLGPVAVPYRRIYQAVAGLMALTVLGAGVWWFVALRGDAADSSIVFVVETVLLVLFAIFWATQTAEFWSRGLPPEALAGSTA